MPDVTLVRRMRPWRRLFRGAFFVFCAVVLILWMAAPTLLVWWADSRLPLVKTFPAGSAAIRTITNQVQKTTRPDVQILLTPSRARSLAAAATDWWVPPWIIRSGQQIKGDLQLPLLRPQPFVWEVITGGLSAEPFAGVLVNHLELSAFLRTNGQTVIKYGGQAIMSCTYVVTAGHITDVTTAADPPLSKRLWVEARGSIILQAGSARREVPVRRLAGHAITTFTPDGGGYRMAITVRIEESDADVITVPVLGDVRPMLLKQLETAANDGLADGLKAVWLPAWTPLDTRVEVVIE
jgi:hypothetical protein